MSVQRYQLVKRTNNGNYLESIPVIEKYGDAFAFEDHRVVKLPSLKLEPRDIVNDSCSFKVWTYYVNNRISYYKRAENTIYTRMLLYSGDGALEEDYGGRIRRELPGVVPLRAPSAEIFESRLVFTGDFLIYLGFFNKQMRKGILDADIEIDIFSIYGETVYSTTISHVPFVYLYPCFIKFYPGIGELVLIGRAGFDLVGDNSQLYALVFNLEQKLTSTFSMGPLAARPLDMFKLLSNHTTNTQFEKEVIVLHTGYTGKSNRVFLFRNFAVITSDSEILRNTVDVLQTARYSCNSHSMLESNNYALLENMTTREIIFRNGLIDFIILDGKKYRQRFVPFYRELVKSRGIISPVKKYFSGQIKSFGGEEKKLEMIMDPEGVLISIDKENYLIPSKIWEEVFQKTENPLKYYNDYPIIKVLRTSKLVSNNS